MFLFCAYADDFVLGECRADGCCVGLLEVEFVCDDEDGYAAGFEVAEYCYVYLVDGVFCGVEDDEDCVHLVEPFDGFDDASCGFFCALFGFGAFQAAFEEVFEVDFCCDAGGVNYAECEFFAVVFDYDFFFCLDFAGFVGDL